MGGVDDLLFTYCAIELACFVNYEEKALFFGILEFSCSPLSVFEQKNWKPQSRKGKVIAWNIFTSKTLDFFHFHTFLFGGSSGKRCKTHFRMPFQ